MTLRDPGAAWWSANREDLIAFRRDLHMNPELARQETRTSERIGNRLSEARLSPKSLDIATGLTCDLGGGDGPLVVLRADIDALPLDDEKQVSYRSRIEGVSHACGHDAHAAVVLGAGLALADLDRELPGTVRLIFQPAEETMPGGALDVIASGALEGAALAFACHCDPGVTVGKIGVRAGAITSSADSLEVVLTGPGGHTSRPYRTVDLIAALAAVANDVPAALHSRVDARSGVSVVWGTVHAGRAHNAIPQRGVLQGTVRMLDASSWEAVPDIIDELVQVVATAYGAVAEVSYVRGVPPVVNTERATSLLMHAAEAVLGNAAVLPTHQSLGGEDFGWMLQQVPGSMFRLGVRPVSWTGRDLDLHQGSFDIDEEAIGVGMRVMVRAALDALDLD